MRYFNVYGPGQDPASQYAAVIPKFISAVSGKVPIEIFGDGEQTRDFTFVGNVVDANLLAASANEGAGEVVNIACGNRISLNQLADYLMQVIGNRVEVIYTDERKGDVRHSIADISKASRLLKYEPRTDIWEGLRKSVSWYLG